MFIYGLATPLLKTLGKILDHERFRPWLSCGTLPSATSVSWTHWPSFSFSHMLSWLFFTRFSPIAQAKWSLSKLPMFFSHNTDHTLWLHSYVCDYWIHVCFLLYCITSTNTMPVGTQEVFVEWGNKWVAISEDRIWFLRRIIHTL